MLRYGAGFAGFYPAELESLTRERHASAIAAGTAEQAR
jgi:hypothetical protein